MFSPSVACGSDHVVLLKTDGSAVSGGNNAFGQCDFEALEPGVAYTQVAAGASHTVLLLSDGTAVAVGSNTIGQCDLPDTDATYTQVACGAAHTVLLKRDGTAVAFGYNVRGQCDLPDNGATYTQVARERYPHDALEGRRLRGGLRKQCGRRGRHAGP